MDGPEVTSGNGQSTGKNSDYFHTLVPSFKKLNIRFRVRRLLAGWEK
jgi:hypothetical protein